MNNLNNSADFTRKDQRLESELICKHIQKKHSRNFICVLYLKSVRSGLRQFLATECHSKIVKNASYVN